MKRFLLAVVLFSPFLTINAQNITVDKVNQNGSRIIGTDGYIVKTKFTDRNPLIYSLKSYATAKDSTFFYLCISISSMKSYTIPQNGILLIKTCKNDIIECKQLAKSYETEDILGTYIPLINQNIHISNAIYPISESDLLLVIKDGIKKVRLETEFQNIDCEYNSNKSMLLREKIEVMYNLLHDALKTKKDIRDGF